MLKGTTADTKECVTIFGHSSEIHYNIRVGSLVMVMALVSLQAESHISSEKMI